MMATAKAFRPAEYFRPASLKEALELLAERGEGARVIAGGTDLLVRKDPSTTCLIDLHDTGLNYMRHESGTLRIGAATTISDLLDSTHIRRKGYRVIREAATRIGSTQTRNMATVGGNICNAAPSADLPPALIALDANASVVRSGGCEAIPLDGFFLGAGKTVLRHGHLLQDVHIPRLPQRTLTSFVKLARSAQDIAVVNAAVRITVDRNGRCAEARIVLGAVAPTPMRAKEAEKILHHKRLSRSLIRHAAKRASKETRPITDVRASAEYRRDMSEALVGDALEQILETL